MSRLELITDLSAIKRNALEIKQRVKSGTLFMCVVKADAYGHGAIKTCKMLDSEGIADAYAVATPAEGRELRLGGIMKPIVVLGLMTGEDDAVISVQNSLDQAIDTIEDARLLDSAARRLSLPARAHIKVDTGMRRIGVNGLEALKALLGELKALERIEVTGLFTHFCAADEDEAFTLEQLARYKEYRALVLEAGFKPLCHAAASTAMLKSGFEFDMVRAGIALYGTGVKELGGIVRPAQTLVSSVVALRRISKGESVGYSRTFTAQRDSLIATVPCGYGDGYPRMLSNRADVLICGRRAPIAGNVCMDMLMADVTDIPGVKRHSPVVLMGSMGQETITPDELAQKAGTIPYEIMLGFSNRVERSWIESE